MQNNPLDSYLADTLRIAKDPSDTGGQKRLRRLELIRKGLVNSNCNSCALHEARGAGINPVPGEGRGRIMFIGHRVGRHEAYTGAPAIGDASKYGFRLLLETLAPGVRCTDKQARDFILDYAYITNGARCGHDNDVSVTKTHWKSCGPKWLFQEYVAVDPAIIVFWSKTMAESLLNHGKKKSDRITIPGLDQIFEADLFGTGKKVPCMVMTHPVRIAREPQYETAVRTGYQILARWLYDEGHLLVEPDFGKHSIETEHKLVTTEDELVEMIHDLWDKPWLAIDTETTFSAAYGKINNYEKENGAVLWYHKDFDLVTIQLCGFDWETVKEHGQVFERPAVQRTYTICLGFKDPLTGQPQQELSVERTIEYLDALFRQTVIDEETGEAVKRFLCMWNAGFDCPVLTRFGLDLLGLTHQDYAIQIIDGMLVLARIDEHLGSTRQAGADGRQQTFLSLNGAAKMFLGESKGSFTSHFDPLNFPYIDISDPVERERVLNYTGEDPRKTILVVLSVLNYLGEHAASLSSDTDSTQSSVPQLGFGPFPMINEFYSGSRMKDVAVPIDHQMLPSIAQMEMVGFKLDIKEFEKTRAYAMRIELDLLNLIRDRYPWFNPEAPQDALKVVDNILRDLARGLNTLTDTANNAALTGQIYDCFQLDKSQIRRDGAVREDHFKAAFENVYGPLDAKQKTIKEKLFIYLEASHRLLEDLINSIPDDTFREKIQAPLPLVDIDTEREFFDRVFVFKQFKKKWSTYFVRFHLMADENGIIHPSYRLTGTVSGRFSGNFQNVPRGGEEDEEYIEELLRCLNYDLPADKDERKEVIRRYNRLDVRQYIQVLQPNDLNRIFARMNLYSPDGKAWRVRPTDTYVNVSADFAAQEDRMAYALTGDETKQRLLSNPDLDTHSYNVAYCFGPIHGFDASTEEGVDAAYEFFTKAMEISKVEAQIKELEEEGDAATADLLRATSLAELKAVAKRFKTQYRTPMKTVHYASQYGAAAAKLHTLLAPLFQKIGRTWTFQDTDKLKAAYDQLYAKVTAARQQLMKELDERPFVEYPLFGAIRHAKLDHVQGGKIMQSEYLSVANAINQGTSAYITKLAMLRLRHLIQANAKRWNLVEVGGDNYVGTLIQVHDEIGVICPIHLAYEVGLVLESAMKIIVAPPAADGFCGAEYDPTILDHRGKTGWLMLRDNAFKGTTLFDADAEVKITVAKAKTLADGRKNVLATFDEEHSIKALRKEHPAFDINSNFELILGHADSHELALAV